MTSFLRQQKVYIGYPLVYMIRDLMKVIKLPIICYNNIQGGV